MTPQKFEMQLRLTRAMLWLEQVLRCLLRPCLAIGFIWLLILLGLPQNLNLWGKLGFWALGILVLIVLFKPVLSLCWPSRAQGLARLETGSKLLPHSLSAFGDGLAFGAQGLWELHQAKLAAQLNGLRLATLQIDFGKVDPLALRHGLALSLIAVLTLQGGPSLQIIRQALPGLSFAPLQLDGWLAPPAYTGQAPILLAKGGVIAPNGLSVPIGSRVVLQLADPDVQIFYRGEAFEPTELSLQQSGDLVIASRWREFARWQIKVTPDVEPSIDFVGDAQIGKVGELSLPYHMEDDYGVVDIKIGFSLSDQQEDGEGLLGYGPFLSPPPQVNLNVPGDGRKVTTNIQTDLTRHAWAGLYVDVRLVARDGAGQLALSEPKRVRLPERPFEGLVARVLAEQRRFLLRDPDNQPRVVAALDAMSYYPDPVLAGSANWLELRAITRKLYRAQDETVVFDVADELWNLAVRLDSGSARDAKTRLEIARDALMTALKEQASAETITQKLQALRQAMQDYLRAMADAARRGEPPTRADAPGQIRELSAQDLGRMLDQLAELAQKGDLTQAQDVLAALDQLLQNLQIGQDQGQRQGQGQANGESSAGEAQARAMQDLRELLSRQQGLMDETYGLTPDDDTGAARLSNEQQALRRQFDQFLQGLADQGLAIPEGLGTADKEMQGAATALQNSERQRALGHQQQALEQMLQAQQSMAQQLTGQVGPSGSGGKDPLNRNRVGSDQGFDRQYLDGEAGRKHARDILDELRRKRGLPGLTRAEEDYFDRLMRGLY